MSCITEEARALIGTRTPRQRAYHLVEASEVRRFTQAVMDTSPLYWDDACKAARPLGGAVTPLAYPTNAFRRAPGEPDPLDSMDQPGFEGITRSFRGLPAVPVDLPRLLNGGFEYEFFRHARVGDAIYCASSYRDIYERRSRAGEPMVFVLIEDEYSLEEGDLLLRAVTTVILR
jgi:N-terminal half of MaoC dehydratase